MLNHLDDLEADFRAIYHEEKMMELPSATFFALAERTFAYPGVLRARLRDQEARSGAKPTTQTPRAQAGPAGQRWNLRQRGGEAVSVPSQKVSYLHEKLKKKGTP